MSTNDLPTIENDESYRAVFAALQANEAEIRGYGSQATAAARELEAAEAQVIAVRAAILRGDHSHSLEDAQTAVRAAETRLLEAGEGRSNAMLAHRELKRAADEAGHQAAMKVAEALLDEELRLLADTIAAARVAAEAEAQLEAVQEAIIAQFPERFVDKEASRLVRTLDPERSRLSFLSPTQLEFFLGNMRLHGLIEKAA